jgi:AraC-like DNA-binding protein
MFVQPLPTKMHWYLGGHAAVVAPLQWTLVTMSVAGYWAAAWRTFVAWQRWLALHHAAAEEYAAPWLRRFLQMTALVLATGVAFAAWHVLVAPLSYFDVFGLYVVFALIVDVLGVEGWRHAALAAPHMTKDEVPTKPVEPDDRSPDWAERGHAWAERVRAEGWYRQPDLTVAQLARLLGTNTAYLSRAFNEGVGQPFSAVINRMRVAQACAELELGHGVLATAMRVGFGSKATFNRVFREVMGTTPSAYRSRHAGRLKTEIDADVTGNGTP